MVRKIVCAANRMRICTLIRTGRRPIIMGWCDKAALVIEVCLLLCSARILCVSSLSPLLLILQGKCFFLAAMTTTAKMRARDEIRVNVV
jgi:hypothetical protein